jgi:xanthine/uracil permease
MIENEGIHAEVDGAIPGMKFMALGAQHAVLVLAFMVYPLAVAQGAKFDAIQTAQLLTACIIATGAATLLHYFKPPWGSGVLAIEIVTPAFLPVSIAVASSGGVGALATMSMVSGLVGLLFARAMPTLRALFPAEVCGVAIIMLGISLIRPGVDHALNIDPNTGLIQFDSLLVAFVTLASIVGIAVFGRSQIRLLALVIGLGLGVVASIGVGLLGAHEWQIIVASPWVGWPQLHQGWIELKPELIPLSVVMALVLNVDNIGMLVSIQRQIQPGWSQIDYQQARAGVSTSSVGDLLSGVFGGMPTGISSANISLAHATGVTARKVSLIAGLMLLGMAFTPMLVLAFTSLPNAIVGAVMLYAAAYMLVSGMSLCLSRLLSPHRLFVLGLSLVIGLTPALVPEAFAQMHHLLRPILESSIVMGTLSAMLLVVIFRVGEKHESEVWVPLENTDNESLIEYQTNRTLRPILLALGEKAGVSKAFAERSNDALSELLADLTVRGLLKERIRLEIDIQDQHMKVSIDLDQAWLTSALLQNFKVQHWAHIEQRHQARIKRMQWITDVSQHRIDLEFE